MGSDRDDELARTATAPGGSSSAPAASAAAIGPTLGRYRLERELGAGGMGVVHAAFDPDLERRIALKVLRTSSGGSSGTSDDAQKRLLREARAMARLTHPNVVTVHEVGSAGGRDYVAMELVEGETLAEWMRSRQRPEHEIIEAFLAAGRGLAAAHAAGIVHRDFKPHNVLRHRNGRIVVTDFGLAREAHADPLAVTRPVVEPDGSASLQTDTPSSPLSGLTVTGSVLGTPAYMAPEQWKGGVVTPATDQFAFCVALWEALAGERPFRGATIDALRAEVERGPDELDDSKIPRRLRRALRRGLDPDQKRRWPSMDSLLAAMTRAERRPGIALIVAGFAVIAAAVIYLAMRDDPAAVVAETCPAPARDIETVWPADAATKLAATGQRAAAEAIDADARAWRERRAGVCAAAATDPLFRDRLTCLDGVLARLDAVARAAEPLGKLPDVDAGWFLIDPAVCDASPPPHLKATATPHFHGVIASLMREAATPGRVGAEPARALIERVKSDPCASALARLRPSLMVVPAERDRQLAEAMQDSERCGDDRVRAELGLIIAKLTFGLSSLGAAVTSKLELAQVASQRVPQRDLQAEIDLLRAKIARQANNLDEAISRIEAAVAGHAARGRVARQISTGLYLLEVRQERATASDFEAVEPSLRGWHELALDKLGPESDAAREVERGLAWWDYANGDPEGARARLQALHRPEPNDPSQRVAGRVLDDRGRPVAGATVYAAGHLVGDSAVAGLAIDDQMRMTTSKADGTFEIPDAADHGMVIAQLADRRSRPARLAETLTLKLEPTTRIEGRVDLRGEHHLSVGVFANEPAADIPYATITTVDAEGKFAFDGIARRPMKIAAGQRRGASVNQAGSIVKVGPTTIKGIALRIGKTKRVLHVLVRSTVGVPVSNAEVLVMAGSHKSMSVRKLRQALEAGSNAMARQIEGEHAPAPVIAAARPGDVFATMSQVPEGAASACALALPAELGEVDLQKKIDNNLDKIEFSCVPIPEGAQTVVVETPPFPRLD